MNQHTTNELEIIVHRPPQKKASTTPLLFVHGAFTSAWCWEDHYLPFFAAAGFEAHAVSLSGHGHSRRQARLDNHSITDYVNDVREVASTLSAAPVLIGHSMGGFVVQKYLEKYPAPAAVLMCSVPPQGLMSSAVNMMLANPNLLIEFNRVMTGANGNLDALRDAMFAQPVSLDELQRVYRHAQPESHRALWDMTLLNVPSPSKIRRNLGRTEDGTPTVSGRTTAFPLLVTGAALDRLMPVSCIEMTARTYDVKAKIFSGMGHGIMLEQGWQEPADYVLNWISQQLGLR